MALSLTTDNVFQTKFMSDSEREKDYALFVDMQLIMKF